MFVVYLKKATRLFLMLVNLTTTGLQANRPNTKLVNSLLKDYDPDMPPTEGSTLVHLGIYVNSIHSISERTMDYSVNIYLRQKWQDPRLKFDTQSNETEVIRLQDGMWTKIWTPDVAFRNEKKSTTHHVTRENKLMTLTNKGDVFYVMKLSLVLDCQMCLKHFPMDRQSCPLKMESFSYTNETISFEWLSSSVELDEGVKLPQFRVTQVEKTDCSQSYVSGSYSCLQANFILQRDFGYYITQIYAPTVMIVILSWVGFWISIDAIPARVTLGLLTVLTITTQRSNIGSSLPRVSYVKAVDIWMAVCLIFVFASLLEFAVINYMSSVKIKVRVPISNGQVTSATETNMNNNEHVPMLSATEGDIANLIVSTTPGAHKNTRTKIVISERMKRAAQWVDKVSRFIFPLLFIMFNIGYWGEYMFWHNDDKFAQEC